MLQAHVNEPCMLVHVARKAHECVLSVHSLLSVHAVPLPVYPTLHEQVYEPAILLQLALALQLCELSVHSLASAQARPLPV